MVHFSCQLVVVRHLFAGNNVNEIAGMTSARDQRERFLNNFTRIKVQVHLASHAFHGDNHFAEESALAEIPECFSRLCEFENPVDHSGHLAVCH